MRTKEYTHVGTTEIWRRGKVRGVLMHYRDSEGDEAVDNIPVIQIFIKMDEGEEIWKTVNEELRFYFDRIDGGIRLTVSDVFLDWDEAAALMLMMKGDDNDKFIRKPVRRKEDGIAEHTD